MTTARLGLEVTSQQAENAAVDLDKLAASATKAEGAAKKLTTSSRQTETATAQFNREVSRSSGALAQVENSYDMAAAAQGRATIATRANSAALQANAAMSRMAAFQQRNLVFQLNDVAVSLVSGMNPLMVAAQQGSQIATIYGPDEGGIGMAFRQTGNLAKQAVTKFWPLAVVVGAVAAGVAGLQHEINETSDVTVSFGDTALATWQVISSGIYTYIQPAVDKIREWFGIAWDWVVIATRNGGNWLIREFVGAVDIIGTTIMSIPDFYIVAGETAANGFVAGIEWMVQKSLEGIQNIINGLNDFINQWGGDKLRSALGWGTEAPQMYDQADPFTLGRANLGGDAASARLSDRFSGLGERREELANWDPMGEFFGEVQEQAIQNATDRLTEFTEQAAAANDNIKDMGNAFGSLGPAAMDPFAVLKGQMAELDESLAQGKISWDEYGEAAFRANSGAASSVLGLASGLTGALSQMFEDNKAFAIANAVVNTAESITKALATYGPTPWGFAAAGVAAASGAAQIAAITSANKGSSSSASVGSSSVSTTADTSSEPSRTVNVRLEGNSMYTGEQVAELLNEYISDGGTVNVIAA